MDLKDKKVIVTGGVKGIGRRVVDKLSDEGALVVVFDIDTDGIKALKKWKPDVWCIQCDVTNFGQIEASIDKLYEELH
jgi:NAD(P)-dependent dehydrogenase (short-subunit alcohol dehydrogenase family)